MERLFETERLIVRTLEPRDAERLCQIHSDDEVKKWIPNEVYGDAEEARKAIAFFAGCAARHALPFVLAAECRETGELIGDTGINAVEGKPEEVEIGFVIGQAHRGRGYAAELVKAMTAFAVSAFGIQTLYGRVMSGNEASVRVLEKNGYRFAAEEFGAEDDPYGKGMLVFVKTPEAPAGR